MSACALAKDRKNFMFSSPLRQRMREGGGSAQIRQKGDRSRKSAILLSGHWGGGISESSKDVCGKRGVRGVCKSNRIKGFYGQYSSLIETWVKREEDKKGQASRGTGALLNLMISRGMIG